MLQGLADATTVCEQTSEEIQNNPKLSIKKTNPKLFTSKVSSTKKKKSVTRKDNKRFKTMVAVSQDRRIDLDSIGKYQIGDDSALSEENGEIPFLNQSKSLVVYDYLKKRCPNAFSDISERPVNVDTVVIDAEAEYLSLQEIANLHLKKQQSQLSLTSSHQSSGDVTISNYHKVQIRLSHGKVPLLFDSTSQMVI